MSQYHVASVSCPAGWVPASLDDVPPGLSGPVTTLASAADLFAAVRQAIEHNEKVKGGQSARWAIVVDSDGSGRLGPNQRLCTPITYKVTSIWRPEGWEPASPLDVPNCVWKSPAEVAAASAQRLSYPQAVETIRGLNQQSIDAASPAWYVILAVENEPVSETVAYDPSGSEVTTIVRRLFVVHPESGGHGYCGHCPAHAFQCATSPWSALPQRP